VEVVGLFPLRFAFTRKKVIKDICLELGKEGWELAAMTFNSWNCRYILVFKKPEE